MEQPLEVYGESEAGVARVGLRQTNLTTQLEGNKKTKKYRGKAQSIMFNVAMTQSKSSLHENMSLYSGTSNNTDMSKNPVNYPNQNHGYPYNSNNNGSSNGYMNHPNYANQQPQQGYYNQQYPLQQQWQNHPQGYNQAQNYQPGNYNPNTLANNNIQPGNYNPNMLANNSAQPGGKKNYRESYMYLNSFTTGPTDYQQQQNLYQDQPVAHAPLNRMSGSPATITQGHFSSQNSGIIGSPMSLTAEENARKISFNALMGTSSHLHSDTSDIADTLNYMNTLDQDNDHDWESIDDEGGDTSVIRYQTSHTTTNAELSNIIQKLQSENRGLKKKLKDIELGHDSHSIVAEDEKFSKLEDQYNELIASFELLENESKNLLIQNDSYFKDITRLRGEVNGHDKTIDQFNKLVESLIEHIPNYIKEKEQLNRLFGDIKSQLPEKSQALYSDMLNNYTEPKLIHNLKSTDGNFTDDDIIRVLKDEVAYLNSALVRSNIQIKNMDKIYTQKIQEERKTIVVSSMQKSLHSEFINENPETNNTVGLKNFRILNIVGAERNEEDGGSEANYYDDSNVTFIPTPPESVKTSFSPGLPISPNLQLDSQSKLAQSISPITPKTPITPNSNSSLSPRRNLSAYSNHGTKLDGDGDDDGDDGDAGDDDFYSTHSKNRISARSLEMEYETFTS